MKLIHYEPNCYYLEVEEIAEHERPPMVQVEEYQVRIGKSSELIDSNK